VKRRAFLGTALAAAAGARGAPSPRGPSEDFEALWRAIDSDYAYFDDAGRSRWRAARARLRPRVSRADAATFMALLEGAIAELRDDHVTISGAGARAERRIPYELDIWPRWRDGGVVIESVRTFGDADVAGLHAGLVITRVQDIPVEAAMRGKLGSPSASVADIEWALRHVVAGPRIGVQRIEVRQEGRVETVNVERTKPLPSTTPNILGRRMGEERDIGYVRVRVGAADPELVANFAGALGHMSGTRALIVDLRESAGPGSRGVTLAILSHFANGAAAWQLREAHGKPRASDVVRGNASPYGAPIGVLVDRWTAGEAEALAAGLAAVADAKLIGTPMAGLRGELHELTLPASGLVVRYPGERTFVATTGEPREALRPAVPVNLAAPSGGPGDPILYQALKLFEKR